MKTKDVNAIAYLIKDKRFKNTFKKLCIEEQLDNNEKEYILTCSLIFFNFFNKDNRSKAYFRVGYYILLKYCNYYGDFKPLYDISLQLGFYPLIDYLIGKRNNKLLEIDNSNMLLDVFAYTSYKKNYKSAENYIESYEQKKTRQALIANHSKQSAFIAPTSYGKSSIIHQFILTGKYSKIIVIVPTKSLLIQTYNDVKRSIDNKKIILHDEMFNNEKEFIGILTQERASRLLVKNPSLIFDIIFIDEAHKLLERDSRNLLLSRVIQISSTRNNNQKTVFLSPLVEDVSNLITKKSNSNQIFSQKINLDFKSYEINLFDKNNSYFYDKFLNTEYLVESDISYFQYVIKNSKKKNFIFNSRPIKVEKFALDLEENLVSIEDDSTIKKIINTLSQEVHQSFYINKCLKKGIIYIHAKIPNIIKEYLEFCFKEYQKIKYIIANSVILEGINLPIDTIFITSNGTGKLNQKLKEKDLINLVGRVNRLNYVFQSEENNLNSLVSKIHFLNHSYYQGSLDIRSSIKKLRDHSFKDSVLNPLLQKYNIEELKFNGSKEQKLAAKEKQAKEDVEINGDSELLFLSPNNLHESLKKYFIENSLNQFFSDLDSTVKTIKYNIDRFIFSETESVLEILFKIIFINNTDNIKDFELERLKNISARNYYDNFLKIIQKQHLRDRINSTLVYLEKKSKTQDPYLYIGTGYGELSRESNKYKNDHYNKNVYVDLRKSRSELVNLAIVKLKIEEDFISYKLNSLIAFLHDFKVISDEYYYNYIYGTNDQKVINLARYGLSINIIYKFQKDRKLHLLDFDNYGNLTVLQKTEFAKYLEKQPELFKFEVSKYLN